MQANSIASRCIYGYPIFETITDDHIVVSVVNVIASRVRGDRYVSAITHLLDHLTRTWVNRVREYVGVLGTPREGINVVDYVVHLVGLIDAIIDAEKATPAIVSIIDGFRYEAIDAIGL